MFDGRDLEAAERWVDDWQGKLEGRAAKARELSTRLTALSASARSADGLVDVTLGPSGAVTDLRLDEGVRRQSASRTAQQIMATIAAARQDLADAAAVAVADTVGADSQTGRAVLKSFPPAARRG
jgi:DNA-binding protein YbaB